MNSIELLLKNKTISELNAEIPIKSFVFFQNPKNFILSSLLIENFNPNHKFYVSGIKKHKHKEIKHYERIAMFVRLEFLSFLVSGLIILLLSIN